MSKDIRIIIHVGLPKCGSTTIQNHLIDNSDLLCEKFGVLYSINSNRFNNHYELARLLREKDDSAKIEFLLKQLVISAKSKKCHTIVISSEDLIFTFAEEQCIQLLLTAFDNINIKGNQLHFVMLYRDLNRFLLSLTRQLWSNGRSLLEYETNLITYYLNLIKRFIYLPHQRSVVNIDQLSEFGGLLPFFYKKIININFDIEDRRDNVWGDRGFVSEIVIGQILGLYTKNRSLLANENSADKKRIELRNLIDNKSNSPEVGNLLSQLDLEFEKEFGYFFQIQLNTLPEDLQFLNGMLLRQPALNLDFEQNFLTSFPNEDSSGSQIQNTTTPHDRIRETTVISSAYGKIKCFHDDLISNFLVKYGEWSKLETDFICANTPENARIFDIGSFIGTFGLGIQKRKPKFLLGVEPNWQSFNCLQENWAKNLTTKFQLENKAVTSNIKLVAGMPAEQTNLGSFRILEQSLTNDDRQQQLIEAVSLYDLRKKHGPYDLLKLDIEGSELSALKSDWAWIKKNLPTIWLECNETNNSLIVFDLLRTADYDIYYFRYPAYNPQNFNKEKLILYPGAFEAGLFATRKNQQPVLPKYIADSGANLILLSHVEQLRQALWLTPRWARPEWPKLDKTELLAMCSRLALNKDFNNFLLPTTFVDTNTNYLSFDIDSNLRLGRFTEMSSSMNDAGIIFAEVALEQISDHDLLVGAIELDKAALFNTKQNMNEVALIQRYKALTVLKQLLHFHSNKYAKIATEIIQKQYIEIALLEQKRAESISDDLQKSKADSWNKAFDSIACYLELTPKPDSWVYQYSNKIAIEAAVTNGMVAEDLENQTRLKEAILYWRNGIKQIESIQDEVLSAEKWIESRYLSFLLKAAISIQRIIEQDDFIKFDDKAPLYFECVRYYNLLINHSTNSEEWIYEYFKKILISAGIDFCSQAEKVQISTPIDSVKYWKNSSYFWRNLHSQFKINEDWVFIYQKKALLEGGVLAGKLSKIDNNQNSIKLLFDSCNLIGEYLIEFNNHPRWLFETYISNVSEALKLIADGKYADANLSELSNVLSIFVTFLKCNQDFSPTEFNHKISEIQDCVIEISKFLPTSNIELSEILFNTLKVISKKTEIIDTRILKAFENLSFGNKQDWQIQIDVQTDNLNNCSGIARLSYKIKSEIVQTTNLSLLVYFDADQYLIKPLCLDAQKTIDGWIGIHTHLLPNKEHLFKVFLTDEFGRCVFEKSLRMNILNEGDLAQIVTDSLKKFGTKLFISDHCDSSYYDYKEESIRPWFDQENALEQIQRWVASGKISQPESEQFTNFVSNGFCVFENLIDANTIDLVRQEIENYAEQGYQDYEMGSSQRITHLHKLSTPVHELLFDRRYLNILDLIFGYKAEPCQSLTYLFGSEQAAHQDTIHLTPFPAGYMCGIWIALEDVKEGSGELEIYPGSHRLPRTYMQGANCKKVKDDWTEFADIIITDWGKKLLDGKFEKLIYRPKKGTVLIWHENLMHAGSPRLNPTLSRKSIVFHCFAQGSICFYDSTGDIGYIERIRPDLKLQ